MSFFRFDSSDAFVSAAVEYIVKAQVEALKDHSIFSIALSGGNTPIPVYRALAETGLNWSRTHFFFGDDRMVLPGHTDSNYRMAHENLFSIVGLPHTNVHRMSGEVEPDLAAEEYEEDMLEFFEHAGESEGEIPRFDCILLGMGPDGHTASLFPGYDAVKEGERLVVDTPPAPLQPHVPRATFTLPLINAAANVLFLVGAKGKEEVLETIEMNPAEARELYPAAQVHPQNGNLDWYILQG